MRLVINLIIGFVIISCSSVFGVNSIPNQNSIPAQGSLFCPTIEELTKSDDWWTVATIWKSDTQSAGKKIKSFIGAQWIGVRIGKIICLYKEDDPFAFPVALLTTHPVLIIEPTYSTWIPTKQGYKHCISNEVKDCPFFQQKQENIQDPYEQLKYQAKEPPKSPFTE